MLLEKFKVAVAGFSPDKRHSMQQLLATADPSSPMNQCALPLMQCPHASAELIAACLLCTRGCVTHQRMAFAFNELHYRIEGGDVCHCYSRDYTMPLRFTLVLACSGDCWREQE